MLKGNSNNVYKVYVSAWNSNIDWHNEMFVGCCELSVIPGDARKWGRGGGLLSPCYRTNNKLSVVVKVIKYSAF